MYIMIRKVNIAIIIVSGRLLFVCRLLLFAGACLFYLSKYISKFKIAYGIMSRSAIDKNSVPENVIAMLMTEPSLKHFMPEINLPNTRTSPKKMNINTIFIIVAGYMFLNIINI